MFLLPSKFAGSPKFWLKLCVSMGVMFIRHRYLKIYISEFYQLGISLKRRYMSIRWCKENANIRICSMIFLLAKNAGSSRFWV